MTWTDLYHLDSLVLNLRITTWPINLPPQLHFPLFIINEMQRKLSPPAFFSKKKLTEEIFYRS